MPQMWEPLQRPHALLRGAYDEGQVTFMSASMSSASGKHPHAKTGRGVCYGKLDRTPYQVRGKAIYKCPDCGYVELSEPPSQPGLSEPDSKRDAD